MQSQNMNFIFVKEQEDIYLTRQKIFFTENAVHFQAAPAQVSKLTKIITLSVSVYATITFNPLKHLTKQLCVHVRHRFSGIVQS